MKSLIVNEIFYSIQGESLSSGLPTIFIRLTGCPLRCQYCDTSYAFTEGKKKTFEKIRLKDRLSRNIRLQWAIIYVSIFISIQPFLQIFGETIMKWGENENYDGHDNAWFRNDFSPLCDNRVSLITLL